MLVVVYYRTARRECFDEFGQVYDMPRVLFLLPRKSVFPVRHSGINGCKIMFLLNFCSVESSDEFKVFPKGVLECFVVILPESQSVPKSGTGCTVPTELVVPRGDESHYRMSDNQSVQTFGAQLLVLGERRTLRGVDCTDHVVLEKRQPRIVNCRIGQREIVHLRVYSEFVLGEKMVPIGPKRRR